MIAPLRVGFVTGATPDKWARSWRAGRRESLHLVPVTEADQLDGVRDGSLDMAIVRLPVDREGLHCVRLYDELQVAVASRDHVLAAAGEEVTTADLVDEQLVRPHASGWTPTTVACSTTRGHGCSDGSTSPIACRQPTSWSRSSASRRMPTSCAGRAGCRRGRT